MAALFLWPVLLLPIFLACPYMFFLALATGKPVHTAAQERRRALWMLFCIGLFAVGATPIALFNAALGCLGSCGKDGFLIVTHMLTLLMLPYVVLLGGYEALWRRKTGRPLLIWQARFAAIFGNILMLISLLALVAFLILLLIQS